MENVGEIDYTPPPRFSPDNSPEARALRVAATSDFSYDHALAWIHFRGLQREEPTEPPSAESR